MCNAAAVAVASWLCQRLRVEQAGALGHAQRCSGAAARRARAAMQAVQQQAGQQQKCLAHASRRGHPRSSMCPGMLLPCQLDYPALPGPHWRSGGHAVPLPVAASGSRLALHAPARHPPSPVALRDSMPFILNPSCGSWAWQTAPSDFGGRVRGAVPCHQPITPATSLVLNNRKLSQL